MLFSHLSSTILFNFGYVVVGFVLFFFFLRTRMGQPYLGKKCDMYFLQGNNCSYLWEKSSLKGRFVKENFHYCRKRKWNWMRIHKILRKINTKISSLLLMKLECHMSITKINHVESFKVYSQLPLIFYIKKKFMLGEKSSHLYSKHYAAENRVKLHSKLN